MDIIASTQNRTAPETKAPVSIQAWKNKTKTFILSPQSQIEQNLNRAAIGQIGRFNTTPTDVNALRAIETPTQPKTEPYAFNDVLDVINPLHHIPVVSTLYRNMTGDEIKPMSRVIGGSLFGGPVGAVTSTLNVISEMRTGQDLNDQAFDALGFGSRPKAINPELIYRHYQETDSLRTANWDQSNKTLLENQQPKQSFYKPITEVNLSPMPPRTLIDA